MVKELNHLKEYILYYCNSGMLLVKWKKYRQNTEGSSQKKEISAEGQTENANENVNRAELQALISHKKSEDF